MKQDYLNIKISISFLLTLFTINTYSQVQDGVIDDAGDIAFVAYHDTPDGLSFVFLDDCPNNTTIRFVDEEWTGAGFSSATSEGETLWTNNTGGIIPTGTVIHIQNADDNGTGITASSGTASEVDSGFTTANGDQVYAITGTRAAPGVFLAFIGDVNPSSPAETATLTGTGLTLGQNAIFTVSEGYYSGSTVCNSTITDCVAMINNVANWTFGGFNYPAYVPNTFSGSTLVVENFQFDIIKVYPNPASDVITITGLKETNNFSIYNVLGFKVNGGNLSGNENINIEDLTNGLYFLKFENGNTIKFIKE